MTVSIPANTIVSVQPSVLAAGGLGLEIVGLFLTDSTAVPIGTVQSFSSSDAVKNYFGSGSVEASYASVYFLGYNGSAITPQSLLFAQYNQTDVSAYIRGGNISALPLATLQSYSGSLVLSVDGYIRTGAINLSAVTSFSDAASSIQTALNLTPPSESTFTGTIGASFTGDSTATTTLTVSDVSGYISIGDVLSGTGVTTGTTIVSQVSGTIGGAGIYTTSVISSLTAVSVLASSGVISVSGAIIGDIKVGQTVTGFGIPAGTIITSFGTGSGNIGTYNTNLAPNFYVQLNSESMIGVGTNLSVSYSSTSGSFLITSGVTGVASTIDYPTSSAIATNLLLTQATGAVLSQGTVAASPITFMDALLNQNQSWVTFTTTFDPDGGMGNTNKMAFATWTNDQNNGFVYVCADTDAAATVTVPATTSMGYLLAQSDYSGTCLIYQPSQLYTNAFVCGAAASVDYAATNGKITFKFRSQTGLTPGVTSSTVAGNLTSNGYNYYGDYATRSQQFQFFANGVVSGPFLWLDAYINQIWLNNALQQAIFVGLQNVGAIPYNAAGNALIEALCTDPINAGVNFGAIVAGVALSSDQAAEINQSAGANISNVIQTRGWYLQILPASALARASRSSPPCTLWYTDGGAVQQINLASIDIQ